MGACLAKCVIWRVPVEWAAAAQKPGIDWKLIKTKWEWKVYGLMSLKKTISSRFWTCELGGICQTTPFQAFDFAAL